MLRALFGFDVGGDVLAVTCWRLEVRRSRRLVDMLVWELDGEFLPGSLAQSRGQER